MTARPAPLLGAVLAALPLLAGGAWGAPPPGGATGPLVLTQLPKGPAIEGGALAAGTLRRTLGEGGRIVRVEPGGATRVLTAGFQSAADPEVSFDGKKVLFAAKREAGDPWCVFEMWSDGTDPRKITCGKAGARQPVYLSTVYTITPTSVEPWVQVAFVGEDPGEGNEAGVAPNTSIWSCKTDGTALRRLTYNLSNDMDPVVLPDGRLVYAGWLRHTLDHGPQGRVALLGVNEDGTDYQVYAGDAGLRVKQMPAPTAGGLVVFVEGDEIAGDGSGRLAVVSQRRPLHSHRALTGAGDGLFHSPSGLADGSVLVSWRPRRAEGDFGVYRFDPATGAREKVFDDPAWHDVQARLLAARRSPEARSSVVREDDPAGKLYAIDVGIHDLGARLPKGTAKRLRLVEGVPAPSPRSPVPRLLGEIPLAEDGSFQVQIPSNTPVQLELVDGDGLALRRSAWIWVRPHAAQGCVGCHEDPERTPPNRFVRALVSPAPVLDLPPEKRRTVTYADDVKPIVEAKCLSCHGEGEAPPKLGGAEGLAPYVVPGASRRSPLVWHVLGRNTARPWDGESATAAFPKPIPAPGGALTPDEIRTFVEWIDLGGRP